ncbi:tetratricopeptide repeat protein [Saccharopolyspora sp. WRP15-2]|uniref:Tetratricopeptide repeat protein n=1 Tax=Saccharopolyspora oryzae TaxID=2997343 RepID=A0ABT4UYS4_9PSEU|nr:tetratricopeptide repeat protein [Saccharopolyspora oryzae]MDA3626856.1 tetratricopeptide repeat protein [Saccharopolyspora oryzae]
MSRQKFPMHPDPAVVNAVEGTVAGNSVQAGVVHGGVHVHFAGVERAGPEPAPDMLPGAPRFFVERDRIAEILREILADSVGRSAIVVVSGVGGAGKSALVSHWLRSFEGDFPDGALYADLGAFSAREPTSPSQVLETFVRALGTAPELIPADLDQLRSLYCEVTSGKRLVLFLDDAVSAAQVRPLLPHGESCLVVVTSRYRLSGLGLQGAHFLDVGPLQQAESLALLSNVLGPERVQRELPAAREVADLCGGLPVALMVAAARLMAHRKWSLQRIATDLQDERRRLPSLALRGDVSVKAVFDISYRKLTSEQAELYRVLADHPGTTFGPEVAAAAVGRALPEVLDGIEALVEANLLDEPAENRFRFHDLLRLHAREQAAAEMPQDERTASVRRMVSWYLDCAFGADRLITPGRWYISERDAVADLPFSSVATALEWLEQERANLVQAQREAAERDWSGLTWQFGEAMWSLFVYRKHYRDWLDTSELAVRAAEREGNPRAESRLRGQFGHALLNLHRLDEGQRELTRAMVLAEQVGDLPSQATATSRLGILAKQRGKLDEALAMFRRALELDHRLGDRRGAALRTRRIGETLAASGRYEEAIGELSRSVDLMLELPDPGGAARVSTFLGETHVAAGHPDAAVTALRKALTVMREIGSNFYVAELLAALGAAHERADDLEAARSCLWQACELYEEIGGPHVESLRNRLAELPPPSSDAHSDNSRA